jgi:hypothetical protein
MRYAGCLRAGRKAGVWAGTRIQTQAQKGLKCACVWIRVPTHPRFARRKQPGKPAQAFPGLFFAVFAIFAILEIEPSARAPQDRGS